MPPARAPGRRGGAEGPRPESLSPLPRSTLPPTARRESFNGRKQRCALLVRQGLRWSGTLIFVLSLVVTIVIFQHKDSFNPRQKSVYNFLNLAWSVALGLSVSVNRWRKEMRWIVQPTPEQEGIRESAKILRWKLRERATDDRSRDMIMAIESLQECFLIVLEIVFKRPVGVSGKSRLAFIFTMWVSVNFHDGHWNEEARDIRPSILCPRNGFPNERLSSQHLAAITGNLLIYRPKYYFFM